MIPRLKDLYLKKTRQEIMKQHNFKNISQVPIFEKIVINVGVGEAKENSKLLTATVEELTAMTGQKAIITRAKKSISNFKIRKGMAIGTKVTLRGNRMWEFFDRFVNIALPRVRDFRGLDPEAFDKSNNYSLGIKEQIIFPEINYDKVEKIHGMDITFVIKNRKKIEAVKDFLSSLGLPFRKVIMQDVQSQASRKSGMISDQTDSQKNIDRRKSGESPGDTENQNGSDRLKSAENQKSVESPEKTDNLKRAGSQKNGIKSEKMNDSKNGDNKEHSLRRNNGKKSID